MRFWWLTTLLLFYNHLPSTEGSHYRQVVPARTLPTAHRQKTFRTVVPKREVRCAAKAEEAEGFCTLVRHHVRREATWHNIAELKRDLEVNPPPPPAPPTTPEPPTTTSAAASSPKPKKKGRSKKVNVKVMKYVEVTPEGEGPPPQAMMPPAGGSMAMPPGFAGPPSPFVPPPMGPIPRWAPNQPPPPWAHPAYRPPWADAPASPPYERPRSRQPAGDALDRLLAEDSLKKKGASSSEKWPLKGDSDRHRWESREGSDLYWELESSKRLATWDPRKTDGPIWKGGSTSTNNAKRKWEEDLDKLAAPNDEWNSAEHGGVPKPPLKYLRDYRRP